MGHLKTDIKQQAITDIQTKLNNNKEKLKKITETQEEKLVSSTIDAGIISVSAGFLGGFATAVFAYRENISFQGKRTEIIDTFFQEYPEQIPLAIEVTKIRYYDAMLDFLNNTQIGSTLYNRIGLTDYFNGLANLTIAETIIATLVSASIPLTYYFASKHYNDRKTRKINNEIKNLEEQLDCYKKN